MFRELNLRLLALCAFVCALAAAATPYVVLKLGMSVDLAYGGMFLGAYLLGRHAKGSQLAVQLNIVQTTINVVAGIGFMCVILAAFYYIQNEDLFNRDIGFDPAWWQVAIWVTVSAVMGIFMGVLPRRMILNDSSLPWPTGKAVHSVADTLTDPGATDSVRKRRDVLTVSTAVAGFITILKDGLGVITPIVGKKSLGMMFGLEMAGIGLGMLIPLAVGLSGLLGVWLIYTFGDTVAQLTALSGTAPELFEQCRETLGGFAALQGGAKTAASTFLTASCGKAMGYVNSESHFKLVVQWMMWPATAMMIAAALTSVGLPLLKDMVKKRKGEGVATEVETKADEEIPRSWVIVGITFCVVSLVIMMDAWFSMPWQQVLVAIAIQPILIIAGLRVLGLTGTGPVSLMANATQFVFGLIWPHAISQNLCAAHVSADPQASSEGTIVSFWVARRLGGKFKTLILAQIMVIPIAAILLPFVFSALESTYGIGLEEGQLAAPTGLKIATLAMVMEKGVSAMPPFALGASVVAIILGVVMELMLVVPKRSKKGKLVLNAKGNQKMRFWWVPIPSALGFALILPPVISLALATGSVIAATWNKFSTDKAGSYQLFAKPLAAGLIAGEAMVGAILLPALAAMLPLFERGLKLVISLF